MIAVTGANGQLGSLVISSLLSKTDAGNIVALVREPENALNLKTSGVHVRKADYNIPETLIPALSGVEKLLLISGNDLGHRVAQHKAVVTAAKEVGVELFAYTSLLKADHSAMAMAEEHKLTEEAIKAAGLPAVILRNGWYTENYTRSLNSVLSTGVVYGAAGNGKVFAAAREDYAEAASVVLVSSESQIGKVYELAGDQGFTLEQYAAEISRQSGRNIVYQDMSCQEYTDFLKQAGIPEEYAVFLADAEMQAGNGWLANDSHTLSMLIGRATTPMSESVRAAL
ncbi:SDR family oxidoreductase [Endozoicomonas elysicola]|uniref:Quinone oxidoreductase n=1 Tax=Endozoicomonas elysicola TaxID=305900 RepID=A0A081K5I3_9GAMM|nr:SDR family oxidoreductase [Endozoicomonas elysicola]KEI69409.1 quinone oxidoreductase [Endozoicomonas elysicola]